MSLPASGPISFSQINTELARSATAQISLNTAEDSGYAPINTCSYYKPAAGNPASMSEWRGYNHAATCPTNGYCGAGGTVITLVDNGDPIVKTVYIGAGPARLIITYGSWLHNGQQFPANGTKPNFIWWRSRITVSGTSIVYRYNGDTYASGQPTSIDPTVTNVYPSYYFTFYIPSGSDSIRIEMEGDSPNTIWDIRQWLSCGELGSTMNLHWSPDTSAHACDSNYSYYEYVDSETQIYGFSGYRQYLVIGGFQVGGKISIFPNGTQAYSGGVSTFGYTGGTEYTFPDYANGNGSDGYYSDGTNWALVSGGSGVITSVGSCTTGYTISWASDIAVNQGGYLSIDKNSVNQVYVTNTTTGSFTANSGDTISITVSGTTYSNLSVFAFIYVDSVQEQSGSATNSVTVSHSFTVSGAHYISGVVYDQI